MSSHCPVNRCDAVDDLKNSLLKLLPFIVIGRGDVKILFLNGTGRLSSSLSSDFVDMPLKITCLNKLRHYVLVIHRHRAAEKPYFLVK